jgi:demethylmenaquinone methyltransferase/2-methoxy-6-polyprenyl-1,4-benzoquinol methylase
MALNKQEIRDLYRKRAKRYDFAILIYGLVGFRVNKYRREAVTALNLKPGDLVIDLACGTGLNFPYLKQAVGERGKIIGVDLTDAMLDQARARVRTAGWQNVELVQSDLANYEFPAGVSGILSTMSITLVPEYDEIIKTGAQALRPGTRLAVLDFKKPDNYPDWLIRFVVWLNKPYGVSLELLERHPWESMKRHLNEVMFREYYLGILYLSVGEIPESNF